MALSQGVLSLTKVEIRKDLREIDRNIQTDSDSDDTIKSEDILPSSYPVKPRKTPKASIRSQKLSSLDDDVESDYPETNPEESFELLRLIESSRRDILEGEQERERLELQYQVGNLMIISYFI